MAIHAFVVLSNHTHFLLPPSGADQLAKFMQFVNANIAKEAGRLHKWRDRLWSRRYRSIVIADDQAALARLRYLFSHGAKEGNLRVSTEEALAQEAYCPHGRAALVSRRSRPSRWIKGESATPLPCGSRMVRRSAVRLLHSFFRTTPSRSVCLKSFSVSRCMPTSRTRHSSS